MARVEVCRAVPGNLRRPRAARAGYHLPGSVWISACAILFGLLPALPTSGRPVPNRRNAIDMIEERLVRSVIRDEDRGAFLGQDATLCRQNAIWSVRCERG
jgi:hypothetical protein